MKRFIAHVLLTVFIIISFSGCTQSPTTSTISAPKSTTAPAISLNVFVKTDQPEDTFVFELIDKNPTHVGIYKFYLSDPDIPGSGTFEKIDGIPLEKINESTFYGTKRIERINGTLVVGYPRTNWIDGMASVGINQTGEDVTVTVHYWKTKIGIIGAV